MSISRYIVAAVVRCSRAFAWSPKRVARSPLDHESLEGDEPVALAGHLGGLRGAAEGLAALDALEGDARLAEYQPYWAARAALLARTGRTQAAADAYWRAIGLESDPAVRRFLQAELSRARRPAAGPSPSALE
jgi:hypothetical protein